MSNKAIEPTLVEPTGEAISFARRLIAKRWARKIMKMFLQLTFVTILLCGCSTKVFIQNHTGSDIHELVVSTGDQSSLIGTLTKGEMSKGNYFRDISSQMRFEWKTEDQNAVTNSFKIPQEKLKQGSIRIYIDSPKKISFVPWNTENNRAIDAHD